MYPLKIQRFEEKNNAGLEHLQMPTERQFNPIWTGPDRPKISKGGTSEIPLVIENFCS